jgi:hypothetical protein
MHILCPNFGYYLKHEKIQPTFYASDASITQFDITPTIAIYLGKEG